MNCYYAVLPGEIKGHPHLVLGLPASLGHGRMLHVDDPVYITGDTTNLVMN
jgi:hypothetical protein